MPLSWADDGAVCPKAAVRLEFFGPFWHCVKTMDPRYRFTLVMSCLLIAWWLWVVTTTFLIGPTGLNGPRYQQGIVVVGSSVLAGFMVVWLATKLIAWQRQRKTGFEAEPTDEFGTAYEMFNSNGVGEPFNMALSKFQPSFVATPTPHANLHGLEAELLGFLQGYRHWPMDPANPGVSLYEQATARWQVMRYIPNAGPWHRVAALAKDLSIIHALEETRTPPAWYQWGRQDTVSFRRKSTPQPGMSALILSTLPAFRHLTTQPDGPDIQRALLTALRYHHVPQQMPLNAGPLATTLVEGLVRAEAQLGLMDITELDQLTPARKEALTQALRQHWASLLDELAPMPSLTSACQLYRASGAGGVGGGASHWLSALALLTLLGTKLEAELRTTLRLWDTPTGDPRAHSSWGHVAPLLLELQLIEPTAHGVPADVGTFMLAGEGNTAWGPCVLLNLQAAPAAPLKNKWHSLPVGPTAELALDPVLLKARATAQAQSLDAKLREAF